MAARPSSPSSLPRSCSSRSDVFCASAAASALAPPTPR
jgi:hypothetical protein